MKNTSTTKPLPGQKEPVNTQKVFTEYTRVPRLPAKLLPRFKKLCGSRYIDILLHLPTNILTREAPADIAHTRPGVYSVLEVEVVELHKPPPRSRRPFTITVKDDSDELQLLFFNYGKWLPKQFEVGKTITVCGVVETMLTEKQIIHPEVYKEPPQSIAGTQPVYPLTGGVNQKQVARGVDMAFAQLTEHPLPEWLPKDLLTNSEWPTFYDALKALHYPKDASILEPSHPGRERLAFDELLASQLGLTQARMNCKKMPGPAHAMKTALGNKFIETLPFKLTGDQNKAITTIGKDMTEAEPMLRLIQGDVGSGKTVVAFWAMLLSLDNGHQAALMAPTEVLAQQHFENARKWLEPLGLTIELLTGKNTAKQKREIKERIANGETQILIGTHALLYDVDFKSLGLVVVDEQHRFGVKQRMRLSERPIPPNMLVMTATPIPRTLALSMYSDLDITLIQEKPPGRTPIETTVLPLERLGDVVASLKRVLEKGEQAYWVCPLVEESLKSDLAAATQRFEDIQHYYGSNVGLLHGRMKAQEKEQVLNDFREGKIKILISTTVIEVGIDVPQATAMIIEHAERFGLSQLHQLRGRVGRGSKQSNCLLLYASPLSNYAKERLDIMRKSEDGFVIAEKDLELRGPGEILGTAQAGHMVTKVADLREHKHLVPTARDVARNLLKSGQTDKLPYLLKVFEKDEAERMITAG